MAEHVPGTPYKYRHGWVKIIQGTHVTSESNAESIKTSGFKLAQKSTIGAGNHLGQGVYIGIPDTDGENRSEALYKSQYKMRKTPSKTLQVEAEVHNPAVVDYDSFARKGSNPTALQQVGPTRHKAIFQTIPGFAEKYDELHAPKQAAYSAFLKSDKFGTDEDGPSYPETDPSEVLKALGYDSVIFNTKSKKATVGGSQLVVFDPSKVHLKSVDLSRSDLGMMDFAAQPKPDKSVVHTVLPAPQSDATVRSIAQVLMFSYDQKAKTLTHQVAAISHILEPYGITPDSVLPALGLANRGTRARPNSRLAANGLQAASDSVKRVAADDLYYRAAYVMNASKRIQQSLNAGLSQRKALAKEYPNMQLHEQARKGRLNAAASVSKAAGQFGPLLGWYLNPLLNNESECITANGHNFYAEEGTVIGLPGSVHNKCGCKAGPPIPGAALVNDVMGNVIQFGKIKKFKLRTKSA